MGNIAQQNVRYLTTLNISEFKGLPVAYQKCRPESIFEKSAWECQICDNTLQANLRTQNEKESNYQKRLKRKTEGCWSRVWFQ